MSARDERLDRAERQAVHDRPVAGEAREWAPPPS